jgi:hypothetical protein
VTRKTAATAPPQEVTPPSGRSRKKTRVPRVRLTHFEIRRGETVILRIAVADDTLADVGDELGALVKRIAPSTRTEVVTPIVGQAPVPEPAPAFVFGQTHVEHDAAYHADLRSHLVDLFSSLCDAALEDALDVARQERDRRSDGSN